jgi:hypothetical protein
VETSAGEPSTPERLPDPGERQAGEREHAEHYGPLTVERTRKDDGRALIYYSAGPPQQ